MIFHLSASVLGSKLGDRYAEPFEIAERVSTVAYRLQIPNDWETVATHWSVGSRVSRERRRTLWQFSLPLIKAGAARVTSREGTPAEINCFSTAFLDSYTEPNPHPPHYNTNRW